MQRILPPTHRLALFGMAGTRSIEQRATAALPAHTLVRRAGDSVARLALAVAPHARQVWVAAGPGNNGGDGLEAALQLLRLGKQVHVTLAADPARMPADAMDALARARAAGVSISDAPCDPVALGCSDIAIDALLGIGASRAPQGAIATLIDTLNEQRCCVLSVDTPSGLDCETGQPLGGACVRATHALSMLTLKPGLFTGSGRDHAGNVWLDSLGVDNPGDSPDAWLTGEQDAAAARPRRHHAQHKGSFGDVAIVGGAEGMTGAALLAARSALASGAGRVFVNLLDSGVLTHDVNRPELMFRPRWIDSPADVLARSTVVCGCGGGDTVRAVLPRLLSRAGRLVLDADALNAIAADSMLQALLQARGSAGHATVLTPHPLEAARLLQVSTAQVQANRLVAAQELARRFDCVLLLKGSGTVVAAPGEVPFINPTGNAALASAGTGDVLAGWLGGLLAQCGDRVSIGETPSGAHALAAGAEYPPASAQGGAFNAAVAAAFEHGAAADHATADPLRASDLIEQMHRDSTRLHPAC